MRKPRVVGSCHVLNELGSCSLPPATTSENVGPTARVQNFYSDPARAPQLVWPPEGGAPQVCVLGEGTEQLFWLRTCSTRGVGFVAHVEEEVLGFAVVGRLDGEAGGIGMGGETGGKWQRPALAALGSDVVVYNRSKAMIVIRGRAPHLWGLGGATREAKFVIG